MTEKRFSFNISLAEDEHKGLIFDNGQVMTTIEVAHMLNKQDNRIKDLDDLNQIYVDFLIKKGYELSDVMLNDLNNEENQSPRIQNITQLTRFSTELNLKIPITIFRENNTQFKEQQKSLKNLKEDPQLKIIENNEINELEKINGCPVIKHYKIITIKMRE